MKRKTVIIALTLMTLILPTACDLMDMENPQISMTEMHLDRDTIYLMVGDELMMEPVFIPDSVTNPWILWTSSNDTILTVNSNTFYALSPGWVQVKALSVTYRLEDSCMVNVMPRWEPTVREYPYEMMVYANVTIHGKPFDPETMVIGAFVDDEMRGVGEMLQWKGQQYVRIRIGSDISYYDPDGITETVTFRVYNRKELLYETFPQTLEYDGEAHGTLTSLYNLAL